MIWIWVASLLGILLLGFVIVDNIGERAPRIRSREFNSARRSIHTIDEIVNRYYPTLDLVGQAMCDEVRAVISQHRKDMIK